MRRPIRILVAACAPLLLLLGCGDDAPRPNGAAQSDDGAPTERELPPTARPEIVRQFRADRETTRHASDGGGMVQLVDHEGALVAGGRARFTFEYVAGEHGISVGGALLFLAPPYWDWSAPQARVPEAPGYCTVRTDAEGVRLFARQVDRNLFAIDVEGRALAPGETIELVYGAGDAMARVDRYAERDSTFWFRVDGDGDAIAELVDDPPSIDVTTGPTSQLVATVTSTAEPGGDARLVLALLDERGNVAEGPTEVRLGSEPEGLPLPDRIEIDAQGTAELALAELPAGTWRLLAAADLPDGPAESRSNPLWVRADVAPVRWADLHGHSGLSDGTGTPDDYFRYARDVAALDVAALTDHDHWGVRKLDASPELWNSIAESVDRFHEPGRFVALLAYEWTNWIHGHRHVLHFASRGPLISSIDEATDTPDELWDALRGLPAMTFAHHSAGGPIATNWDYAPDPVLEPVTEVMSIHGSSEAADSPQRIYAALTGNFVRDQLARGYRLGFVASGDGHDGHPGLGHRDPRNGFRRSPDGRVRVGRGGVAALRCEDLTRDAVLEALRERDCWATSGPRILLRTVAAGRVDPSTLRVSELDTDATWELEVSGTAPIERVVFVRGVTDDGGCAVETGVREFPGAGSEDATLSTDLGALPAGSWFYARVEQTDGALAWSGPVFVEP